MILKRKSKKADEQSIGQIVGLLIGVAVAIILIWLLISYLFPFDKKAETAKSYLNTLNDQITLADSGKTGSFSIWQNDGFDLVYFGSKISHTVNYNSNTKIVFNSQGVHQNYICVCYVGPSNKNGNTYYVTCNVCESLKYSAITYVPRTPDLGEPKDVGWFAEYDQKFQIKKEGGLYEFEEQL